MNPGPHSVSHMGFVIEEEGDEFIPGPLLLSKVMLKMAECIRAVGSRATPGGWRWEGRKALSLRRKSQ